MTLRQPYVWLILLAITITLSPFLFGQYYGTGDTRDVYLPLETFFHNEQLNGRLPSWNPDIAWGFPTIASAQIGFFYPPLLLLRFLPLAFYFPLIFFLHIVLAATSTYFFARQRGASPPASYLAAIAFGLSGWLFQHATHLNIILTATWLPLQFLVVERLATQTKLKSKHHALLALVIGLPFLAGQLHLPLLNAIVTSCYLLYRRWKEHRLLRRSVISLIVVALLTVAIGAAQLFPTLELTAYSTRGAGGTFDIAQANQYSFPLYHLPTALFPRFFGNDDSYWGKKLEIEHGFFIGTLPLLLAFFALSRRRRPDAFFVSLAIIAFLLALGDYSPFRLIGFEPSLWFFTAPARWLLFAAFAGTILAAHAFDQIKEHAAALRRLSLLAALIILVAVVVANLIIWNLPADTPTRAYELVAQTAPELVAKRPAAYYTDKFAQLLSSLRSSSISIANPYTALPIITLLAVPLLLRYRHATTTLLTLASVELIIIAASTSPLVPLRELLTPPASVQALPESLKTKQARLLTVRPAGDDTGALLTNPASRANNVSRAKQRELLVPLVHSQFDIAGIEWPASLDLQFHSTLLDQLRQGNTVDVALARERNIGAILTPSDEPLPQPPDQRLPAAALYDLGVTSRAFSPNIADITYQAITPTHTQVTVTAEQPTTVVIRDSWYPGWQTTVDGTPVETSLKEDIFRGVDVPAGQHVIDQRYRPRWLYIGFAVSSITILGLGLQLRKGIM